MEPSLPRPAPRPPLGERVRDWVVWFGPGRLVATALAVIAVLAGGTWLLKGSPARSEDGLPFASRSTTSVVAAATSTATPTEAASTVSTPVVVYVTGDVVAPGVYTLPATARVNDALAAAGGPGPNADLSVVNLAAMARDGDRVYVPKVGEAVPPAIVGASPVGSSTPTGPININTASADQLDALPGVGPATAAAIVAHRQQNGPFQSVDDLADVRGIGPAKLDALRGLVTV